MADDEPHQTRRFDQQYGTDAGGNWTRESLAYKRDPTIENYVSLRRGNPNEEIDVHVHGGIDQLYAVENDLRRYGIDPDLFVSIFDANSEAISHFALFFLEQIIKRRTLEKAGETHIVSRGLAVPDKLIDWFITCSLDAMSRYERLEIERDLIVLIRERLGGRFFEYEARTEVKEKRLLASWCAGAMIARGETPSYRKIAERMRVSQTTVMRWFDGRDFFAEAASWSKSFDAQGNLIPLMKQEARAAGGQTLRSKQRAQRSED